METLEITIHCCLQSHTRLDPAGPRPCVSSVRGRRTTPISAIPLHAGGGSHGWRLCHFSSSSNHMISSNLADYSHAPHGFFHNTSNLLTSFPKVHHCRLPPWIPHGLSGSSSLGRSLTNEDEGRLSYGGSDGGDGGNGRHGRGGSGGGGGEGGGSEDGASDSNSLDESEEYGPILKAEDVERVLSEKGITLPLDMATAAKSVGIPSLLLERYIKLQGAAWPLGPAMQVSGALRDRMLADPTFLFKVFTEVAIDSCCATFAEVQKRGDDFWHEFEFYMSDLLVGVVLDIALVGMLAPIVRLGGRPTTVAKGFRGRLTNTLNALPNSCFEAASPGRAFSLGQRVSCIFVKAAQYGVVGFGCGIVGQGIANGIMTLKRKSGKISEEDQVAVPPLVRSAAVWATFMAVSSNTRYQIINGLERVVESSSAAKRVPQMAMAFTVAIRFANNIYGGMQFVDWARLAGVQ